METDNPLRITHQTIYERIKAYLFRTHGRELDIKAFLQDDPDWYETQHETRV